MTSYRVVLTIGRIHPGANAAAVLPDAAEAVAEFAVVDSKSVGVLKGRGQATVRFESDDDDIARQLAGVAANAAARSAEIIAVDLRKQKGTRWPLV